MREAIEKVVADLEYGENYYRSIDGMRASGMRHAYRVAIYKLKEVLSHETNNQHRSDGRGTDDAEG